MGVSTNGIIVFGIDLEHMDLDGETPEFLNKYPDNYNNKFDNFLLEISGLLAFGEEEYSLEAIKEFENNYPLELVKHCSEEYPMYILGLRETIIEASRGYPKSFNLENFNISEDKIKFLRDFCEQYNIPYREPKWYLASMWS